jgi:hypothetical protein
MHQQESPISVGLSAMLPIGFPKKTSLETPMKWAFLAAFTASPVPLSGQKPNEIGPFWAVMALTHHH